MKKIFTIIVLAVMAQTAFAQQTVALLEPRVGEGSTAVTGMEKNMVRGELRKAIVNFSSYDAITRTDIDQMMKEQNFQRTGMVSDAQIKKLGEMSGADYICVSTLTKSNTEFYLEAYLIHLESGKMSNPASQYGELVNGKLANMLPACKALANELLGETTMGNIEDSSRTLFNSHGQKSSNQDFTETAFGINMKMIWVEGGDFRMGCTKDQKLNCEENEKNVRWVKVDGFYIGMLEVTQSQWEKVMTTDIYLQVEKSGYANIWGDKSDDPMYYVNWEEAMEFCRWLSNKTGRMYTLPTEAQWEYAARGGKNADGTMYSGSDTLDEVAWFQEWSEEYGGGVHACGTKKANSLGIYDMSGNVWEWCKDWYSDSYMSNDTDNPNGPSSGLERIIRGGCWYANYGATTCRVAYRGSHLPNKRDEFIGFRVVCLP